MFTSIYLVYNPALNKHLMTGPERNSEFCFPETLNVPRGEAKGNIEVEVKQNSLFPMGPVIKCLVTPPNSRWNNTLMSAYDFIAKCYKSKLFTYKVSHKSIHKC